MEGRGFRHLRFPMLRLAQHMFGDFYRSEKIIPYEKDDRPLSGVYRLWIDLRFASYRKVDPVSRSTYFYGTERAQRKPMSTLGLSGAYEPRRDARMRFSPLPHAPPLNTLDCPDSGPSGSSDGEFR